MVLFYHWVLVYSDIEVLYGRFVLPGRTLLSGLSLGNCLQIVSVLCKLYTETDIG